MTDEQRTSDASYMTLENAAVRGIVKWLRSLRGPLDPQRLADEIEATESESTVPAGGTQK